MRNEIRISFFDGPYRAGGEMQYHTKSFYNKKRKVIKNLEKTGKPPEKTNKKFEKGIDTKQKVWYYCCIRKEQ